MQKAIIKNNKPVCPNCEQVLDHITNIDLVVPKEGDNLLFYERRCNHCNREYYYMTTSDLNDMRRFTLDEHDFEFKSKVDKSSK